jgi:hypothetical protein
MARLAFSLLRIPTPIVAGRGESSVPPSSWLIIALSADAAWLPRLAHPGWAPQPPQQARTDEQQQAELAGGHRHPAGILTDPCSAMSFSLRAAEASAELPQEINRSGIAESKCSPRLDRPSRGPGHDEDQFLMA